ncbi:NlpC/P60 family protein [Streptantibioticus ferralitis]|uniref:NlpC/P60 family protein n=1 Tax=Streptantibioticus ferralitis TaxID=236510 RepID=A0ABT5Z3G7_9ACTN|nr:NlpC/P60 family protein [Streptantibioticus ferralitis]MDF2258348.1 NlpC/P60 family protein [Streptantibioticus ferralitis]
MGKIAGAVGGAVLLVMLLAAAGAAGLMSIFTGAGSQPSASAVSDIPPDYLLLYMQAAHTCRGLDWTVLAAIGKVETDHGRSDLVGVRSGANSAGAEGPMQFLPSTFASVIAEHPPPEGGATPPSPYNPHDAIYAAAAYLCDSGARDGRKLADAIYAYNHANWYVSEVLAQAQIYASSQGFGTNTAPNAVALEAINYAQGQLGLPYEWGGNGPSAGDAGFDCSGLTQAAYQAAGVTLPRTAQDQFNAGPHVPAGQPLEPGDLVFYGNPDGGIHHVGLYVGNGQMIDAPRPHVPIRIEPYRYSGDDYAGATRPVNH